MAKRKASKRQRRRDIRGDKRRPRYADQTQSVGLLKSIPLAIPTYWTPEEALAVFELIDELRDLIWSHYQIKLLELMPQPGQWDPVDPIQLDEDDLPF